MLNQNHFNNILSVITTSNIFLSSYSQTPPNHHQMGKKKMKFPFLFKSTATTSAAAWPWPACVNTPQTHSFRANPTDDDDDKNSPDSFFSFSSAPEIFEPAVVLGLRSDRLFFEPGETSSILEEAKSFPYKESAALMAMDSSDPFLDFRVSMEEMVEAHGLKDWACLEELLACYLRVNRKSNHGFIVGAFVDLVLRLAPATDDNNAIDEQCSSSSTATQLSFTSPLSFSSSSSTRSSISPCLSLLENGDEINVEKNVNAFSSASSLIATQGNIS